MKSIVGVTPLHVRKINIRSAMSGVAIVGATLGVLLFIMLRVRQPNFGSLPHDPARPTASARIDNGRDFGYRIADPVSVSIFIREPKGCTVDPETLEISGDFEVKADPRVERYVLRDGSQGLLLRITAQSFSPAQRLTLRLALAYRTTGNREEQELTLPPLLVHTSRTWDGRQQLKGEDWAELPVTHWPATMLLICVGAVTGVYFGSRLAKIRRRAIAGQFAPEARSVAIAQFCKLVLALQCGDHSQETYSRLCGLIRTWYKMPALPLEFVPIKTFEQADGPVTTALTEVELALFSGRPMNEAGIERLMNCGSKMFFPALDVDTGRQNLLQMCAIPAKEVSN